MEKPIVTRKEIETKRRFEFSAPYLFEDGEMGRVRTELTINYTTKEYHFLESGRYFLENSKGRQIIAKFKKGDDLDMTFDEMFSIARSFAEEEIKNSNKLII